MLAYSDMKNMANFMLLYSVWKPAHQFRLAFGQVKGHAIGFRNGGNEVNEKADGLRKNVPMRQMRVEAGKHARCRFARRRCRAGSSVPAIINVPISARPSENS